MAKLIYNNIKNIDIRYKFFKLNYSYHLYSFYKKNLKVYINQKMLINF